MHPTKSVTYILHLSFLGSCTLTYICSVHVHLVFVFWAKRPLPAVSKLGSVPTLSPQKRLHTITRKIEHDNVKNTNNTCEKLIINHSTINNHFNQSNTSSRKASEARQANRAAKGSNDQRQPAQSDSSRDHSIRTTCAHTRQAGGSSTSRTDGHHQPPKTPSD